MGNVSIRNVKFRGGKDKQQKFAVQLSKFQKFKVSDLRWQSNMGNINIWNVSIRNTKCRMQGQTAKIWGEGFNVALRSKLCYNILIYYINLSNLWQLAAHWDSWNVLWWSMIGLKLIDIRWFDFELWIHTWIFVSLVNCKVDYANIRAVHKQAWARKKL